MSVRTEMGVVFLEFATIALKIVFWLDQLECSICVCVCACVRAWARVCAYSFKLVLEGLTLSLDHMFFYSSLQLLPLSGN